MYSFNRALDVTALAVAGIYAKFESVSLVSLVTMELGLLPVQAIWSKQYGCYIAIHVW